MPDFAYVARDLSGHRKTGSLSANSQHDVLTQLDSLGLMPVEIKPLRAAGGGRSPRVSGQVMANAYNQLASLLRSGVPLLRALTVMSQQASKPALKRVLDEVKAKVEEGEPLPNAMARF